MLIGIELPRPVAELCTENRLLDAILARGAGREDMTRLFNAPCVKPRYILQVPNVIIRVGSLSQAARIPFIRPRPRPITAANTKPQITGPV